MLSISAVLVRASDYDNKDPEKQIGSEERAENA